MFYDFYYDILTFLDQLPELQLYIPRDVFNFCSDLIVLLDCFIVYNDFVPLLRASILFSAINLSFSIFEYFNNFKHNYSPDIGFFEKFGHLFK